MTKTPDNELVLVYAQAAGGQETDAFYWLLAWHGWCHAIDDYVDEPGAHDRNEIVDHCADGIVLTGCRFFRAHADTLAPLIVVVAEEWRQSLASQGTMLDVLRLSGNHVVLAVAYLTGGRQRVREVSERLWPIVEERQLAEKKE